jgi:hypothetical protein
VSDTTTTTASAEQAATTEGAENESPKAQERIRALVAERAQLRAQLDAVAPKLAEATTLAAQLAAAQAAQAEAAAAWQAKATAWESERAILAAGITDPEAVEVVTALYARVPAPEGGAKPSLAAWLAARDALPRGVRAYLPDAQGGAQAAAAQSAVQVQAAQAQIPKTQPKVNAGAATAAGTSGTWSAAEIMQAMQTPEGRARYAAARATILGSLGKA